MKLICKYCGSPFNDTMEHCPNCGAPNDGVVRTTASQPRTIEELQSWYAERGLPPYEKTRFFIGENHKGPKAFGIYRDDNSGNIVVYKNKADGSRAVRYEGTDEAYAVNELLQRLKEEIIQQKRANVEKKQAAGTGNFGDRAESDTSASFGGDPGRTGIFSGAAGKGARKKGCGCLTSIAAAFAILFLIALISVIRDNEPKGGYYNYRNTGYYYMDFSNDSDYDAWYSYDEGARSWGKPIKRMDAPGELSKNKTAKKYFVSSDWSPETRCPNFEESPQFLDAYVYNRRVNTGYYSYGGRNYYHLDTDMFGGWYVYDNDGWVEADGYYDVPEELTHQSTAEDFYYTPDWDEATQIMDFEDTEYYTDRGGSSYYDYDSDTRSTESSSYWDNDDDDYSYDWDDDDDWDSGWDSYDSDWGSDWDSDW